MRNLKLEDAEFTWQFYEGKGELYFKYKIGPDSHFNQGEFDKLDLYNIHRCLDNLAGTDKKVLSIRTLQATNHSFLITVFVEKYEVEKVEEFLSELDGIEVMMTCDHEFEFVCRVDTWLGITDKHVCKYCGVKKFANEASPDIEPTHI